MIRSDRSRSYSYFKTKFRIFQDVGGHRSGLQLQSLRPEETLQASVTSGINASYFSSTARSHQRVDSFCPASVTHQCSWNGASRLTSSTDSSCFYEAFSCKTRKTKYGFGVTGWLISSLTGKIWILAISMHTFSSWGQLKFGFIRWDRAIIKGHFETLYWWKYQVRC